MSEEPATALGGMTPASAPDEGAAGDNPASAASPDAASSSTGILSEAGGFAPGWYKDDPTLADSAGLLDRFATPADLARSHVELNKIRSGPPGEGATDETRSAFRKYLGVPETYDYKPPEGKDVDTEVLGAFTSIFEESNGVVNNDTLGKLVERFTEFQSESQRQAEQQEMHKVQAGFDDLAKKKGRDWDTFRESAINALTLVGEDPASDPTIGNNPRMIEIVGKLASLMSEGTAEGVRGGAADRMATAGGEAERMVGDPNHPDYGVLGDTSHPRYAEVNSRYLALIKQRNRLLGKA